MRPVIATVTTARPWERHLVQAIRATGLARIGARCVDADHLLSVASRVDAVFLGSDAPWISGDGIRALTQLTTVIGVVIDDRDPMRRVLVEGGAMEILTEDVSPMLAITAAIGALDQCSTEPTSTTVAVTGARGAPGRSEVALALAWCHGSGALLAELDGDAPSLGLRTGLAPADATRDPAVVATTGFPRFGSVSIFAPPVGGGPLSPSIATRVLDAARATHDVIVVDAGPGAETPADTSIVVCDPSPVGVVRCARLLDRWMSHAPLLVVNRADDETDLATIRRATGLEPAAVVPASIPPIPGEPPPPAMCSALGRLSLTAEPLSAA